MGIWQDPSLIDMSMPVSVFKSGPGVGAQLWSESGARVVPVSPGGAISLRESTAGSVTLDLKPTVGLPYDPDTDLFLGRVAHASIFVRTVEAPGQQPLRRVLAQTFGVETELAMRATALAQYHADNGYCPRCGGATVVADLGRTRWCEHCQETHFPRLDPAIIVAIIDQRDRLLLGHHVGWEERRGSVFAGFTEAGESLEQTVRREVREEVGLTVEDVRYFGSQPWPMPRSLMVGFTALASGAMPEPDGEEITSAQWYSRCDLRAAVESDQLILPPTGSIAQRMIKLWLAAGD